MLVALVVFIAAVVQGIAGFGGALVAMPLLVPLLGIQIASPAFAMVAMIATLLNAIRWRAFTTPRDLTRLLLPALIGILLGVWLLASLDAAIITRILGGLIVLYAGYALLGLPVPRPNHSAWTYTAGFSSGLLSGAFNTGGPPAVMFASASQWEPNRFRGNLQAFFLFSSIVVTISHALAGHYSSETLRAVLWALPALLAGHIIGYRLCLFVNPAFFRRLVLVMLLLLGARLLIFVGS
ncbi:MAG: sulfite exporter TauE/SafE family protein [Chloroflexota bacterium]|jgi:uncharacterized protein